MTLWIVMKNLHRDPALPNLVEFQGVFSTEERAEAACRNVMYFMAPATLDEALPDATVEWPGVRRPNQDEPAMPEGEN